MGELNVSQIIHFFPKCDQNIEIIYGSDCYVLVQIASAHIFHGPIPICHKYKCNSSEHRHQCFMTAGLTQVTLLITPPKHELTR